MYEKKQSESGAAPSDTKAPEITASNAPNTPDKSVPTPPPLKPFSHSTPPAPRSAYHPDVPAHQPASIPNAPMRTPSNIPGSFLSSSSNAADIKLSSKQLMIGKDVNLKGGEISSCDHLILDGSLEDTSLVDASHLDVTPVGRFKGTAVVDDAVIAGSFEGDLSVRGRLTLKEGGTISGSVQYGSIVIEPGGTIRGDMKSFSDS
jgi:cytoskeletal protein CcmA (bactofilin family)